MSIRVKLILIFIFLAVTPVIFGFGANYFYLKKEVQQNTMAQLASVAKFAQQTINLYEDRLHARAQDWVSDGRIRETVGRIKTLQTSGNAEKAAVLGVELGEYIRSAKLVMDPSVSIVDVFNTDGVIVVSTEPSRIGHTEPPEELQREYVFHDAKMGAFGSIFSTGIISLEADEPGHSHSPTLHYSVPLWDIEKNISMGVMTIHVFTSEISTLLQGSTFFNHKEESDKKTIQDFETLDIYLVNHEGFFATESRFIPDVVLKKKVDTQPTRACLNEGHEYSGIYADYRGIPVFGKSLCPAGKWWMLIVEVDENEINALIAKLKKNVLLIAGLSGLGAVLLGLLVSAYINRRIHKYTAVVTKIAQGDFTARTSDVSKDEIGQAAMGVNAMAEKLETLFTQNEALDQLKNKFIQIVSHQLRTPLNSIRWNLEMLMDDEMGSLKKEQKEFIRLTHAADIEIIRRIDDMLTAMDIEEERIVLRRDVVSMEDIWNSIIVGWKKKCVLKELTCEYTPPSIPLPSISLDAEKIRRVFEALADNAFIYTEAKGSVTAALSRNGNMVHFEIADTGIGIPSSEQHNIFTRFYRASNASVMKPDASGIGLVISKYFVEQHGGKIGFTSEEGKGSTFWFELPI